MMTFKKVIMGWIDELDKALAFLCLLSGLVLILSGVLIGDRPMLIIGGALVSIACGLYLLIRNELSRSTIRSLNELTISSRLYTLLNILFFLAFSYSILSIHLNPEIYRPLGYFLATSFMTAIVAVEVLFSSSRRSHVYFALVKIILIGFSLRLTQQLIIPEMAASDPWWHEAFTLSMLETGSVPEGYPQYSYMPLFHIMVGVTMLIADLNYKMATLASWTQLAVISDVLFIFLLGRFILGHKVGLLSSLVLMVADHHLMLSFWVIPNTAAAIAILPIIYLLFKVKREKPIRATILCLLLMAFVIGTHALVAWMLAILLFIFWVGTKIYHNLYDNRSVKPVNLNIATLFTVGMLGYWAYISGHVTKLGLFIADMFGKEIFIPYGHPLIGAVADHFEGIAHLELFLGQIGYFLFIALSFIGCFYMMAKKFGDVHSFAIATGGMIILAMGLVPALVGHTVLEFRWNLISMIMLSIPLALALLLLCRAFKNRFAKAGLISIIVFILAFSMTISPRGNIVDDPAIFPGIGFSFAFTEPELHAMDTILHIWDGKVGSDSMTGVYFGIRHDREFARIDKPIYTGDFAEHGNMLIIIRNTTVTDPFFVGVGLIELDHDPRPLLVEQGFSRVYDNAHVSGFLDIEN